ncbi:hypothetical protein DFH09DRAFT_1079505 [Mycena vulgaris]|nr:hypothetical protein DFH09DRAFT_1079505 [Mycena vulgaris]
METMVCGFKRRLTSETRNADVKRLNGPMGVLERRAESKLRDAAGLGTNSSGLGEIVSAAEMRRTKGDVRVLVQSNGTAVSKQAPVLGIRIDGASRGDAEKCRIKTNQRPRAWARQVQTPEKYQLQQGKRGERMIEKTGLSKQATSLRAARVIKNRDNPIVYMHPLKRSDTIPARREQHIRRTSADPNRQRSCSHWERTQSSRGWHRIFLESSAACMPRLERVESSAIKKGVIFTPVETSGVLELDQMVRVHKDTALSNAALVALGVKFGSIELTQMEVVPCLTATEDRPVSSETPSAVHVLSSSSSIILSTFLSNGPAISREFASSWRAYWMPARLERRAEDRMSAHYAQ